MPDPLSLSLLILCALAPTVLITVSMLHINKRVMAENRELLKANLALSGRPEAAQLAGLMEQTDRVAMQHEAQRTQAPQPRRLVGS